MRITHLPDPFVRLSASRSEGLDAAVSPRALHSGGPSRSFFQCGKSPHRPGSTWPRDSWTWMMGTIIVGAILYLGPGTPSGPWTSLIPGSFPTLSSCSAVTETHPPHIALLLLIEQIRRI